jgi:putative IMPACT (imprinted ancient) family translation regulator
MKRKKEGKWEKSEEKKPKRITIYKEKEIKKQKQKREQNQKTEKRKIRKNIWKPRKQRAGRRQQKKAKDSREKQTMT